MSIACRVLKVFNGNFGTSVLAVPCRHGHHLRGKAPGIARSLQQRLAEILQSPLNLNLQDIEERLQQLQKELQELRIHHEHLKSNLQRFLIDDQIEFLKLNKVSNLSDKTIKKALKLLACETTGYEALIF